MLGLMAASRLKPPAKVEMILRNTRTSLDGIILLRNACYVRLIIIIILIGGIATTVSAETRLNYTLLYVLRTVPAEMMSC
jgi:hypothetical protein